jgi:AbrB family looped-hinge helix DNA binding protein
MKSIVSEKGQVTIPKSLRDSLAIRPGTELDFVEENGALVARRVVARDALGELVGLLPPLAIDEAIAEMRGPAWSPDHDERR